MKRSRTPSSRSSEVSPRIRRRNIRMSARTSAAGRDQFSVEKEYTVSSFTPRLTASRSRSLTVSAPASCPTATDTPRRLAQRPFPSVMIATYRGRPASPSIRTGLVTVHARSDLEDLCFLALQHDVELRDARVGQLLKAALGAMLVVRARVAGLLQLAQIVHHVPADVANRDAALLDDVARHLDQLAPALLGELRNHQAHQLAVVGGVQPEIGLVDRLLDRLDRGVVERLDRQQPRLGSGDRGELLQRKF